MPERYKLMIVAGEPSGDAHAAALVKALNSNKHEIYFEYSGATGPAMRAAGVETVVNSDTLAIMGIVEVGRILPRFIGAYRRLKSAALTSFPDAVVLVDWPEFNLRIAKSLHRRGMKIIYYISPQLWAWRPYRVRNIRRDVDLLLSILPFEKHWYASRKVNHVEFVGHPLAGEVQATFGREEFCRKHDLDPSHPIVALLPGSRIRELQRILPRMLDGVESMRRHRPDVQFVVVVARSRSIEETSVIIPEALRSKLTIVQGQTREALAASDAAAVASGTATLEAAILGTPMVIVYRESKMNWHTLGRLITAEHFGLVNLIAGERLVTELMQNELTGDQLANELVELIEPGRAAFLRQRLREVAAGLGDPGASSRAAEAIIVNLRRWRTSEFKPQN
ncbi:MAG: lipid-A-disaccharide synthase [Pyrinomonadaceae bacterium]